MSNPKVKFHLDENTVIYIHNSVLKNGRPGISVDMPLEAVLSRIDALELYGETNDLFEIAAMYGIAIATGHAFVDGNKRTALMSMYVFLRLHSYLLDTEQSAAVEMMVEVAEHKIERKALAIWLRNNTRFTDEKTRVKRILDI